ncbi:hypothetical protein RPL78_07815, partial [Staphylococcus aureus]|nr:hypothetical protein [Staphylococcus aureus]MDT3921838.1 hypothetical protein [Staphylococcus aureus]
TLIQNEDTPNFNFVKDFDSFKI